MINFDDLEVIDVYKSMMETATKVLNDIKLKCEIIGAYENSTNLIVFSTNKIIFIKKIDEYLHNYTCTPYSNIETISIIPTIETNFLLCCILELSLKHIGTVKLRFKDNLDDAIINKLFN